MFMSKKSDNIDFDSTGLPESYRSLYEANPYANQIVKGGFLGIGRKKALQEMNLESRKYAANIMQQAYSEDYNSAESQAERLKAAGINPDVAGGVSAGDSAGGLLSEGNVDFPDSSEQLLNFTDVLLNIASLAMSLPSGLSSLRSSSLVNGLQLAEAGASLAKVFPSGKMNIAPEGLAPVMVESGVSSERIADSIPYLSASSRKALAKSISMNRNSISSTLSFARNRKELFDLLNSPALSMPQEAANILKLQTKLTLATLKVQAEKAAELAKYREQIAKKEAENAKREPEVVSEELSARSAEAAADRAAAAASIAESGVRRDIAKSTDGSAIGESRTEEAILNKYEAKTAEAQLDVIEEAEDEGLFNTSLVGDILTMKVFSGHDSENLKRVAERFKQRRAAKRANKRYYKQSAGSGKINISPSGVSYSE